MKIKFFSLPFCMQVLPQENSTIRITRYYFVDYASNIKRAGIDLWLTCMKKRHTIEAYALEQSTCFSESCADISF